MQGPSPIEFDIHLHRARGASADAADRWNGSGSVFIVGTFARILNNAG